MNYKKLLSKRLAVLEAALEQCQKILENNKMLPEENLHVSGADDYFFYYKVYKEDGRTVRKYIKKKDRSVAEALAQRDYAIHMQKLAKSEIARIHSLYAFDELNASTYYSSMNKGRRKLVTPFLISNQEYAVLWIENRIDTKSPYPINTEFLTENQELVRSKSEKIIADKLKLMGIPYKYEEPIQIDRKICFPDFTILRTETREEIYWEHFGMIDQPEYRDAMLRKIEFYGKNQIVFGKNLIITLESKDHPISVRYIEQLIRGNFYSV